MIVPVTDQSGRYLDRERVRIGDAARYLGVHPDTLKRGRDEYPRPARVGRRRDRVYSLAELRAYLERER